MNPTVILIALAFMFGAGYVTHTLIELRKRLASASGLVNESREWIKHGQPLRALMYLSESLGYKRHHSTQALVGQALDLMQEPGSAAAAYGDARRLAYGSPFTKGVPDRKFAVQYYWMESYAFASARDWKFAYDRSFDAIGLIEDNKLPRYLDGEDYESKLRVVRMIASLHHLEGTEAFETSQEDQQWIVSNSKDSKQVEMAQAFLTASTFTLGIADLVIRPAMFAESWYSVDVGRMVFRCSA